MLVVTKRNQFFCRTVHGCSIGLFDELVSFFTTMNMYSSAKMQLSDSKEYQDFLQMYTGKTKTCETGMENFLYLTH